MPTRRKTAKQAPEQPKDEPEVSLDKAADEDVEPGEPEPEIDDADIEVAAVEEDVEVDLEETVEEEEEEGEDLDEELDDVVVVRPAAPRPVARPSPGRPPSAKEEPEPPFNVGERVRLVQNTRPRTGTPIGDYPVGSEGRVETVLSQTAIVRFERAPDTKEVVAFVCLESIDEEAKAGRARRERERAREEAAAAEERERSTRRETS